MSVAAAAGPFADRRTRVLRALGADAALVLAASPEVRVGRDLDLRYRPDPDLWYLTGYPEPEAVAVLCPAHEEAPFTLFVRPRDPQAERWSGVRGGPDAARARYGADDAHPIAELEHRLTPILQRVGTVYAPLHHPKHRVSAFLRQLFAGARVARQRTGKGPRVLADLGALLDPMRLIKDATELHQLRAAADVTAAAIREAAAAVRPGAGEWQVEAALLAGFRGRGAEPAFAPIVASGDNATTLHYIRNEARLEGGRLVLIDAGATHGLYAADVSRTFPVNGRFDALQRDLYAAVLSARDAAIDAVKPGATVDDVHRTALRVLVTALRDHGLLVGEIDGLLEQEDEYKPFFPHRTSHWLGLDVHDVGDFALGGRPRALEPGMVLTVEPGLYFPAEDVPITDDAARPGKRLPSRFRGIGIRIEDDVAVTAGGCETLTAVLPAGIEDVEAMTGAR